ncbi:MAG: HXXEE domain-containing protein [Spirochaetes bacterium]|nr:HXXEE domain-containing protein [Spirochaetota bacterium]
MAGAMWILANSFIHISATLLGHEYSPGVVTATALYAPVGVWFLVRWGKRRQLNWKNVMASLLVGGFLVMLIPTFARAIVNHARLATVFHLVK